MTADHTAIVARVVADVWNTGEVSVLDDLLAADYVRHGRGDTTKEELKSTILASRNAFPDLRTEIRHVVAERDLVAVHWQSTGTHRGVFHDLPVTGRRVTITGLTLSRLVDGRIAEEWESWDAADLFASLGVVNLWEAR